MGISFDTAAENSAFAEAQSFGYPLLCDEDRTVGLAYKACDSADAGYPRRITYVIAGDCLLYTSPSPRDLSTSRMPSSA